MLFHARLGIALSCPLPARALILAFLGLVAILAPAWADQWDPADDTPGGATALPAPTLSMGIHGPHTFAPDDPPFDSEDWFSVPLEAGVRYYLQPVVVSGWAAVYVEGDPGYHPKYFTPMCSKTYRLNVTTLSKGDVNFEYNFHYAIANPDPAELDAWDAVDDLPEGGSVLSVSDGWQEHGPHTREGVDWFRIELAVGETVVFQVPQQRCGALYTSASALGACEADLPVTRHFLQANTSFGAHLTFTAEMSDEYYLRLTDDCLGDIADAPYLLRYKRVSPHSADQDSNRRISLSELLRIVQFFNIGGLHCADELTSTEDGYVPGAGGDVTCLPHNSDYDAGPDWSISLGELLRAIQIYNSDGYEPCPLFGTEDGFCVL
jgi:hypothetical protein